MLPPRAVALIPMLASDVDGEALGAARALGRVLQSGGLDFHDLARMATGGVTRAHPPACPVCAERKARETERETARRFGSHAKDLAWLLEQSFAFSEREWDFLQNLQTWKGELTERQRTWFDKIVAKVRAWTECEF